MDARVLIGAPLTVSCDVLLGWQLTDSDALNTLERESERVQCAAKDLGKVCSTSLIPTPHRVHA